MTRIARIVVPGFPHHVTQRGNRQSAIFGSDTDRKTYIYYLSQYAVQHEVDVLAYCLMDNHVHLVLVPKQEDSLSLPLRAAHTRYALYFNTRMNLSGHLWQGRFYSAALDDAHLWAAVRYVERNPIRAGMVARAEDYPWSSAAAHCGLRLDRLLSPKFPQAGVIDNWSAWLSESENPEILGRIRSNSKTGRPCGGDEFIDQIEERLQRNVKIKSAGRPKKSDAKP